MAHHLKDVFMVHKKGDNINGDILKVAVLFPESIFYAGDVCGKDFNKEIVLAGKVLIKGSNGDARFIGNVTHADFMERFSREKAFGCIDDELSTDFSFIFLELLENRFRHG